MMDTDLRAYLLASGSIAAIVSDRVYPYTVAQENIGSCVTYERISGPHENSLDGDSGLVYARFQIISWCSQYVDAVNLGTLVKTRLAGFVGTMGSTVVCGIQVLDQRGPVMEPEPRMWRNDYDFQISYQE